MRNFLKDLHIVGAMLVFREGKIIRHSIDSLMRHCDHVVIVLDNEDEKTKNIVLEYKNKHKGFFTIGWSGTPRLTAEEEARPGALKHRGKHWKWYARGVALYEVEKINRKKKIDILIFPDADEMFTDAFPESLKRFWESDRQILMMKTIQVFDSFNLIHEGRLVSHTKAYKYRDDMKAFPTRFRQIFVPFRAEQSMGCYYNLIHMCSLTKEIRALRKHWSGRGLKPEYRLWKTDKDTRKMSEEEIRQVLKGPHFSTLGEYAREEFSK